MAIPETPDEPDNGWLRKQFEETFDWMDRTQCLPDPASFLVSETPNGRRFSLYPETLQAIKGTTLPFSCAGRYYSSSAQVKVTKFSLLLKTIDPTSSVTITDLDTWQNMGDGDRIWLEVDVSGSDPTASIANGSEWTGWPSPIGWVDPSAANLVQNKAYMLIGELKSTLGDNEVAAFAIAIPASDPLYFVQRAFCNVVLDATCYSGANVLFPRAL